MSQAALRRRFIAIFLRELRVVWPILSGLIVLQLCFGTIIGFLERWPLGDAAYFTFVTGMTIGYGDLVPTHLVGRAIALMIGLIGILLTGLVAALGVQALQESKGDIAMR